MVLLRKEVLILKGIPSLKEGSCVIKNITIHYFAKSLKVCSQGWALR